MLVGKWEKRCLDSLTEKCKGITNGPDKPGWDPRGGRYRAPLLTYNEDLEQLSHELQRIPTDCKAKGAGYKYAFSLPPHSTLTDFGVAHAQVGDLHPLSGPPSPPRPWLLQSCSAGSQHPTPASGSHTFGLLVFKVQVQQFAHQLLGNGGHISEPLPPPLLLTR